MELEKNLPVALFTREQEIYRAEKRRPLSQIESAISLCFGLLYLVMLGATFLK